MLIAWQKRTPLRSVCWLKNNPAMSFMPVCKQACNVQVSKNSKICYPETSCRNVAGLDKMPLNETPNRSAGRCRKLLNRNWEDRVYKMLMLAGLDYNLFNDQYQIKCLIYLFYFDAKIVPFIAALHTILKVFCVKTPELSKNGWIRTHSTIYKNQMRR